MPDSERFRSGRRTWPAIGGKLTVRQTGWPTAGGRGDVGRNPMSGAKRRDFIAVMGGAAAWPVAARAQQPARVRTIGFLLPGGSRTTVMRAQLEAFRQGLKEYGWIEGQNISVEYRFAEGKEDALAEFAAELVRLRLDVIVAEGTAAIRAAKTVTQTI